MKLIIRLLAMLLPILSGAQSPPIKPPNIGDTLPDIVITNVYNYPDSTIRLSDLKGKLVILDFWASWCGSCIQTFPKMHELKKEFGDELQILMVNSYYPDSISKIKTFLNERQKRTGLLFELTYVLQDSILMGMFPYRQIPHYVWMNKSGIIVAVTSANEVNAGNITKLLKDDKIYLEVKNDNLLFNNNKPLLIDENSGSEPGFIYRSVITGFKKNLGVLIGQRTNEEGKIKRVYVINSSLLSLLQKAYRDVFHIPLNRLIIEAKADIKRAIENPDKFRYCYEIITEPSTAVEIQTYMQQDIFRAFHLKAKNEIRNTDCYVMRTNKNISKSISIGGKPEADIDPIAAHKFIRNKSVSIVLDLVEKLTKKPVVNETNLHGLINMEIPNDIYSFSVEDLSRFLSSKGLVLKPAVRPMESIIISGK